MALPVPISAEEFDKKVSDATDRFAERTKIIAFEYAQTLVGAAERAQKSDIPDHLLEASINASIAKVENLQVELNQIMTEQFGKIEESK